MVNHMTRDQKGLIKHLKSDSEKYVRARSQAEYLQECLSKKILPRSINLCKVVKSAILWENNTKDTFEILFDASEKLVKEQYNAKVKRYEELDREALSLK
jgi:hypothetical protein